MCLGCRPPASGVTMTLHWHAADHSQVTPVYPIDASPSSRMANRDGVECERPASVLRSPLHMSNTVGELRRRDYPAAVKVQSNNGDWCNISQSGSCMSTVLWVSGVPTAAKEERGCGQINPAVDGGRHGHKAESLPPTTTCRAYESRSEECQPQPYPSPHLGESSAV